MMKDIPVIVPGKDPPPFMAPQLKIKRARLHLQELEEEAAKYLASNPFEVRGEIIRDLTTGEVQMLSHVTVRGGADIMSPIIGDIIHNLRAALDLLACELCRTNKQSDEGVYFPFCNGEDELEAMIKRRNFDRAGPDAVKLLRELKPYKAGNVALRAIHDLDIQDKHQTLIPNAISGAGPWFQIKDEFGKVLRDENGIFDPRIVEDPATPSDIELLFPEESALAGREIVPALHELVETAAGVVEAFKRLRTPTG